MLSDVARPLPSPSSARETGRRAFAKLVLSGHVLASASSTRLEARNTGCLPSAQKEWTRRCSLIQKRRWYSHTELNEDEKAAKEKVLKQVWVSYVRDESDLANLIQTKA